MMAADATAAAVANAANTAAAPIVPTTPSDRQTLSSHMADVYATSFKFSEPKLGERGSLGLFDEFDGLVEVWTCSRTITARLRAINNDATLSDEQRKAAAHKYAKTLVLMWVTAENGEVFQILGESRDFSNAFSF